MKRCLWIIALLILLPALLAGGCGSSPAGAGPTDDRYFGLRDGEGNVIRLAAQPQRIVSLNLRSDEFLLDLVPVERIEALSFLADKAGISNVVEAARQVPRRATASAERIIYLRPDLVFATESQPVELIQILRDAGIPVYVYKNPRSVADVKQIVAETAELVGESEAGLRLIRKMDAKLDEIKEKVQRIPAAERKTVVRFTIIGGGGGPGSSFDDACRHAGVFNGAALAGIRENQSLTKEQIVQVNPDVFLIPDWDYYGKTDMQQYKAEMLQDPAFQTITAVQQKRIVEVSDSHMLSTSQYMVYCVEDIFNAAYSERTK